MKINFKELDAIVRDFTSISRVKIKSELRSRIINLIKAFGGCLKCYGKGYFTEFKQTTWATDLPDHKPMKHYKSKPKVEMIFCDCNRGKALSSLMAPSQKQSH